MRISIIVTAVMALLFFAAGCTARQNRSTPPPTTTATAPLVGGPCEGCELLSVGLPDSIAATAYSPAWNTKGQRLLVSGTVYHRDGQTPAPGVILYYWHTDAGGHYTSGPGPAKVAEPHGYIRGWVKTDSLGRYCLYTIRPAPYPGEALPAHIHLVVKEPGLLPPYYIDDWVFDDDPLLIPHHKKYPPHNRGGSGLLRPLLQNGIQVAEDDIILGLNIPHHPAEVQERSGLAIGEDSPSFGPFHAHGPDKGSRTCPVCQYGRYHGILYFVGNRPDWADIRQWLVFLETESKARGQYLKVYFVYGNSNDYDPTSRRAELETLGRALGLQRVALTFVPSLADTESEVHLNRIQPQVGNTFIVYKHRRIIAKYIDLPATANSFYLLRQVLNRGRLGVR